MHDVYCNALMCNVLCPEPSRNISCTIWKTRSLGAPPWPDIWLEAFRASWLRPSRPSGVQAGTSGPLKVRPATFYHFYHCWLSWTILDYSWPFFLTIFYNFDHFGQFWIIFDHFVPFLTILTIFHNFDHFWAFLIILDHFGPFQTVLTIFDYFDHFLPFLTILDHFHHFGLFLLGFFSGRFDTSGTLIPRLVTEIFPCDGFCDE